MTLSQVPGGSILFGLRWGYGLPIVSAHKTNTMIKHTRIINTIDQLKDKTKSGFNYRKLPCKRSLVLRPLNGRLSQTNARTPQPIHDLGCRYF